MIELFLGKFVRRISWLECVDPVDDLSMKMDDSIALECDQDITYQIHTNQRHTRLFKITDSDSFFTDCEMESGEYIRPHEPSSILINSIVTEVEEMWIRLFDGSDDDRDLEGFIINFESHKPIFVLSSSADDLVLVDHETFQSWPFNNGFRYSSKHTLLSNQEIKSGASI